LCVFTDIKHVRQPTVWDKHLHNTVNCILIYYMMRKHIKHISLIFFMIIFPIVMWGAPRYKRASFYSGYTKFDHKGNQTENFFSRGGRLYLSVVKTRFYPNEKIDLKLEIKNTGSYPLTLYINKNYLLNFTILVRDKTGKSLPMKDIVYFSNRRDNQDTFYQDYTATNYHSRTIVLQPQESYIRTINLHNIISLKKLLANSKNNTENIEIAGYFYPNPEQNKKYFLASQNKLILAIERKYKKYNKLSSNIDINFPSISPKETVFLLLSSEFSSQWGNYFKYLSLNSVIKDYPKYARLYARSPNRQKGLVLNRFRDFLMNRDKEKLEKFEILNENNLTAHENSVNLNKGLAQVQVKATRVIEGFSREFKYTFYLTRNNRTGIQWLITGIETQLMQ